MNTRPRSPRPIFEPFTTCGLLSLLLSVSLVAERVAGTEPAGPTTSIDEGRWHSLELATRDLIRTHGDRYPAGRNYLKRLAALKESRDAARARASEKEGASKGELQRVVREFEALRSEILLSNPLLDFDRLLLVRRASRNLGLPRNWEGNSSLRTTGYDNEIAVLSPVRPGARLRTLMKPAGEKFVGDVDLHFDADRMLFSMPGANGRWQVFEMNADGSNLHELPLIHEPDVDNYDACYVPGGRVIFSSTAPFVGVPCVRGSSHVANLYLLEPSGTIRQLTVDQEHNWCPTVLGDGRILYQRWEYSDTPHAFNRLLFHMNPDGTEQAEYYGSNSYWPNAMFYARPIPGDVSKVVAVVGGHHDNPRMGELVLFDPARGRREADGVVQRIPGYGKKVEPVLLDGLTLESWPKFLHPYPLSDKYFLVSCRPSADSLWGVYLVDTFDNLLLLHEEPGYAMLEPLPLRKVPTPPVVPDRVDLSRRDAIVNLLDVYAGEPMEGVPRGTVKALRVIDYHYSYQGIGGQVDRVGLDGPWDVKGVLGTVPVYEDGSARFIVPAYTPLAVQPLDAEGRAVQLMRSWFTAMPGEVLSCVGCHERQNTVPPVRETIAASRPPSEIEPWYGPPRGFSFRREVQPVLDRYCVGCHNREPSPDGEKISDLTAREPVRMEVSNTTYANGAWFTPSYFELRRFVRAATMESDLHVLPPREFHASTTQLVQMLEKGHHNVKLDAEAWDRLNTWIDLNTPAHGTWTEVCGPARVEHQRERRRAMRKRYTGRDEDPEAAFELPVKPAEPVLPVRSTPLEVTEATCPGWPFGRTEAKRRQAEDGGPPRLSIELSRGIALELVRIPSGEFVMGERDGEVDERPPMLVEIPRSFWMGRFEVTNEQFALFDPGHDSRLEHGDMLQFDHLQRGDLLNGPKQPVVRVSWQQAVAFCRWLSRETGRKFALPSEAQWEYACRAGTATPLWYGAVEVDASKFANTSDKRHLSVTSFAAVLAAWRPADAHIDDGARVSAPVGSYEPNPWGLFDMHGNVAEWTRSEYRPHPYDEDRGKRPPPRTRNVVRGGSWYDRPHRCRSAYRLAYAPDQVVFNVGFRVVCEIDEKRHHAAR